LESRPELAHKQDAFDLVFAARSWIAHTYDGDGRRIGLSASTSLADSQQKNVFLKVGTDFGADHTQRLQLSQAGSS